MKFGKFGITRATKLTKKVCVAKSKQYAALVESKKLSPVMREKAKKLSYWYKYKAKAL